MDCKSSSSSTQFSFKSMSLQHTVGVVSYKYANCTNDCNLFFHINETNEMLLTIVRRIKITIINQIKKKKKKKKRKSFENSH